MYVFHYASSNYRMQISFHKVEHEVNVFRTLRLDYVEQTDDVGMAVELLKENNLFSINYYLSICALCISGILECIEDFFEGDDLFSLLIDSFPDNSVGAFAEFLEDFKFSENVWF